MREDRALRPVPDVPLRALGMIRVSKDRDGKTISPEVQRVAITDYCASRGYQLRGWLEGIDESGSRNRSAWWPRLDQAVEAVEAGVYDVIVVWEFSRAARHRLRWNMAVDRVETAGGLIESATERVDAATAAGRFQRGVFGEMHAYRAEVIGEGWKNAHANRVRQGRPANGKPRWGYAYDAEQKLHVPDPETGPVLADLYRRYVAGESVYQLVRWLNSRGWRTTAGGLWSDRSLRRVLDSGFASGRFMAGGDPKRGIPPTLHDGVHEPLIDDDLWQAYLDARENRRARPARSERSQYLLSGLVRCAGCGRPMVAGKYGTSGQPKYRCKLGKEYGPDACRGGYVMASFVEGHVYAWLQELAGQVEWRAGDLPAVVSARKATREAEAERLARELVRTEEALARLVVQNAEAPLPESVYRKARGELEERAAGMTRALEEAQREARRVVEDPEAAAAGLVEAWEEWPVVVRREVLRGLLDCVLVTTGRPAARFRVVPVWETR